jgi:hypothetical protein
MVKREDIWDRESIAKARAEIKYAVQEDIVDQISEVKQLDREALALSHNARLAAFGLPHQVRAEDMPDFSDVVEAWLHQLESVIDAVAWCEAHRDPSENKSAEAPLSSLLMVLIHLTNIIAPKVYQAQQHHAHMAEMRKKKTPPTNRARGDGIITKYLEEHKGRLTSFNRAAGELMPRLGKHHWRTKGALSKHLQRNYRNYFR